MSCQSESSSLSRDTDFPPSQRRASRLAPASQPAASVWQRSGAPEQITCQEARLHTHQKSRGDTEQRRRGRAEANLRKVDLPSLAVSFASQSLRPWAICQTTASCPIPITRTSRSALKPPLLLQDIRPLKCPSLPCARFR